MSLSKLLTAFIVFLGLTNMAEAKIASYYADKFDGRLTASGDTFDQNLFTAAHKTLPFGTVVQVRNLENGKVVKVQINDRGPFTEGREIDLSKRAFEQIASLNEGLAKVELTILT